MKNHLALEKRRTMINSTRAHRYFATAITDKLEREREADLTEGEQLKKKSHMTWNAVNTPDGLPVPQEDRF